MIGFWEDDNEHSGTVKVRNLLANCITTNFKTNNLQHVASSLKEE